MKPKTTTIDQGLFETTFNPLKKYTGKKAGSGVWQKILSEIPKCSLFIEAMAGSGYLSSIIKNCDIIVNDIDLSVVEKYNCTAANVIVKNEDYKKIIQRYDNGNSERVFYFDPPYLKASRSSQRDIYGYEWSNDDHINFLKLVKKIKCPVMISHYSCDLYDQKLKDWRKIEYTARNRNHTRIEALYMNFSQPPLLQHFEYVGKNRTHRQQIKRKIEGLEKRLLRMDAKERAAILSSIVAKFSYVISK